MSKSRASRLSTSIRLDQAENFIQAAGYAVQLGVPPTAFVTLLVEQCAPPGRVRDHLRAWLQRASKWRAYHRVPMVPHLGVLENSFHFGIHAHILMHVPTHLRRAFKQKGRKWLAKDAPARSITVRGTRYPGDEADPLNPMKGRLKYMLKCIDARAGELLGIEPRGRDRIFGKRVWVAQCIGPAAREGRLRKRPRTAQDAREAA